MADYDAQIRLIVSGTRQINELESSLNRVQDLLEELNDLGANAVFGRATNLSTYRNAIAAAQGQAAAIQNQVRATQSANTELRQQALLYSQLNREQALYRRRSTAFTEESRGVRETNQQVIELTTQLRTAQRAFSAFFADADLQGARTINAEISSILEQLREINRIATGTKNVGANTAQLQAQADGWNSQIRALRRRASALEENEEILGRLQVAERNLLGLRNQDMTFRAEANVRLGKQELANAEKLLRAEENIASTRRRDAIDYERQLTRQSALIANLRSQALKTVSKAGAATLDALTFGRGSQTIRGARNAAIRGGIGLGALGVGKIGAGLGAAGAATAQFMSQGPQSLIGGPAIAAIEKFNQVLNSALGGIPDIVAQAIQALGQIPDSLGLAAVAALAFAPAASTAAKSVFNLGKAVGNTSFGRPVASFLRDVNPLARAAYGSVEALQQGLDRLRGQTFDIQEIAATASAVTQQLNESYRKLPAALPAAGETSFRGAVEYDPRIGAFAGGGARRAIENAEFLTGEAGTLVARSREAADATLLFAERLGTGASEATEAATRLEQGAQSAKRIAEYLKQAQELRQGPAETSTQRFIREAVERGRRARQDEVSAQIARERSATLLGGQYSVSQVPARGELFPGGRTETRQQQYRDLLNAQAVFAQKAREVLDTTGSLVELERRLLGGVSERVAAKKTAVEFTKKEAVTTEQLNEENQRSVQIIRERNRELRQRPIAAMTPGERVQAGILDPASLRQQRLERVRRGRDLQERSGRALSEGLVGGAFPLLFGQGLGAAIGGGVGGAAGGFAGGGLGFGLSLAGTGLGSVFDTLNTNLQNLASSLKQPTQALEMMKAAGLRVTPELEDTVKRIEALGFASSAQNLVLKELERQLGQRTVVQLQALNAEQKRLESEWSRLSAIIASGVLPGLTGFVSLLADVASGLSKIGSIELPPWLSKSLAGAAANTAGMAFAGNPLGIAASYLPRFLQERGVAAANKPQKPVGLTPEQARQQQLAPFQAQLDALTSTETIAELGRGLIDQVRAAAREQQDLDRQRADLVESYERAIADIRLGVERRVQQQRLENLAKENEILAKQGEIRLQELRNENAAIRESLRGNEIGQELLDVVTQYTEQQLQTENEIANRRRNLQVELEAAAIATEQYKIDVAKQIADLNRSTAKQVEQIQLNVARRQQDAAESRFGIEKQIALARIEVERVTAQQRKADLTNALATEQDQTRKARLEEAIGIYDRLLAETGPDSLASLGQRVANTRPQRAPSFAGVSLGAGVSTAGLDAATDAGNQLKRRLEELNQALDETVRTGRWQEFKTQLLDFADQGVGRLRADFDSLIAELSGDPLRPVRENIEELKQKFANASPLIKDIVDLTGQLAIANREAANSYEFLASAFESQGDEISSLKDEINVAIAGSTALEQTIVSLTVRGISPATEEFQRMVANAKEIDRLRDKRQILEDITTASLGLSDALRGLVQDTLELGSLSEAIKGFNDKVAKQTLNLFLEIAFRPIEEGMQKGMMEALKGFFPGLDLSTEAQQQVKSLQSLNATTESIRSLLITKLDQLRTSGGIRVEQTQTPGINQYTLPDGTTFRGQQRFFEEFMRGRQGAGQPASGVNQNQLPYSQRVDTPSNNVVPFRPGSPIPRNLPYWDPRWGNPTGGKSDVELKRLYEGRTIGPVSGNPRGMGGAEAFPLPADYPTPSETNPVPVQLVNPPSIAPGQVVPLETVPYQPDSDAARQVETNLNVIDDATRRSAQSTANTGATVTEAVRKNNAGLAPIVPQWQASLGGVVTGLTLATTGVMGILGGIQQIKQGGTGNVLSGIGGILTTVGSIGLSAAGMFSGGAGGAGGAGGFGPNYFDPKTGLGAAGPNFGLAMGGVFDSSSRLTAFAKGGVVKSPTLFRFGDGGQFGVMGEAGAEAVMPLKRGPDGRLGVEQVSEGGDSSSRLHEAMGRSPAQGGQASEVKIKFETTMINGVEYVSKDQLDQAMEQTRKASVSEGSRRGMSMTLDKLKQSPSTRSRIGLR